MRTLLPLTLSAVIAGPAVAAEVKVSVEIPRLTVAEYHRPYVAIWVERPDQSFVGNVAVWYDLKQKDKEGTKWLKDMRQWWRRVGRELDMPVDGLSTVTRPPGEHQIAVDAQKSPLAGLPAGEYHLVVEAAREVGGRELVRLPFKWPSASPQALQVKGSHELGTVALNIKP